MLTTRGSGILLHPTSLPGQCGAGDFGSDAYRFVDWLVSAGQSYWQMLPLGEIGHGNSPYMSVSAFAGNILLIDLVELSSYGWLTPEDLVVNEELNPEKVDFALLHPYRVERLRHAAKHFFASEHDDMHRSYVEFCLAENQWLDDYALFMVIAEHENWREWREWPSGLGNRDSEALSEFENTHVDEIKFWKFCQWCFDRQWSNLRLYANDRGIHLIGDVPIFVAYQSVDVWVHPELFKLDDTGRPVVVAGVPPDYFSDTGQLWGNPLYQWEVHERDGYSWWIARLGHALKLVDMVRIDHFRGFVACWEIQADAPNAIVGKWEAGPADKLFRAFKAAFPHLPVIAEDLGIITQDVIDLRDSFELPGMRILQFAFGDGEGNHFLPHHYVPNAIAYTGTHDNDTIIGWWKSLSLREKEFARGYLQIVDDADIQWDMMRAISDSAANIVIFTMQDVLGLPGEYRMNFPGQPAGSWEWRFSWDLLLPEFTHRLEMMTRQNNRCPNAE